MKRYPAQAVLVEGSEAMKYNLHVTANFKNDEEREWDWEQKDMDQDTLEDALISALEGNSDATSFVLVVSKKA